jgi:hypothetical protein
MECGPVVSIRGVGVCCCCILVCKECEQLCTHTLCSEGLVPSVGLRNRSCEIWYASSSSLPSDASEWARVGLWSDGSHDLVFLTWPPQLLEFGATESRVAYLHSMMFIIIRAAFEGDFTDAYPSRKIIWNTKLTDRALLSVQNVAVIGLFISICVSHDLHFPVVPNWNIGPLFRGSKHKRQTSMPSAGFEPATPATKRT